MIKMQTLSYNIRSIRKDKGLTQEELAERLHVTRQAVSSWERGGSCPDFETLKQIADIFEVSPEQLLYNEKIPKTPPFRKVHDLLWIGLSLVALLLAWCILNVIGVVLYFAVMLPLCTCVIIDEIRNKEFYAQNPYGYIDDDDE
ncbi:MAG: helix-turn-helix transcriptional regulator [Oscillospiraceae bacterium]|nr:helix-turn-helix transcriptional regulator [Oscillospiraceae bacterium]